VRLFVAVEVPAEVRDAVDAVARPDGPDVRWSEPGTWHVTLRFLGEVPDAAPAAAALAGVDADLATATIGRTPTRLGPTAVVLPVSGLDALAAATAVAFEGLPGEGGPPGEDARPFTGHLTLGRLRRPAHWPEHGVGVLDGELSWPVGSIALVRSHLGHGAPARYEVLARRRLGEPAEGP
jgi:2'-5' RNA ligase